MDRITTRLHACDKHDFKQQELSIVVWSFAVFGALPLHTVPLPTPSAL